MKFSNPHQSEMDSNAGKTSANANWYDTIIEPNIKKVEAELNSEGKHD